MQERKIYDWFSGIVILMLLVSVIGSATFTNNSSNDIVFLWNRVTQLKNTDSILGVFFYNDFNGLGYGSSFFYGYLTLVPFTLFNNFSTFANAYLMVTVIILYFGARSLIKCFCQNYRYISFLFISSYLVLLMFATTTLYANYFAIGLSFFFLSYCIKFFRDGKSFIPASILFFLVLNTHMITSFLSFVGCVLLFIKYFDRSKYKQYLNFLLFTSLICSYYIVNFLYHAEGVLNLGIGQQSFPERYKEFLTSDEYGVSLLFGSNPVFFGGLYAVYNITPQSQFVFLSPIVAIFCLFLFIKQKPKKFNIVLMVCILLSFVCSIHYIWMFIYERFNIIIQFPVRYLPYALLLFLILCLRNNNKFSIIIGSYSLLVGVFLTMTFTGLTFISGTSSSNVESYIGLGEYLGDSFIRDTEVFNELNNSCRFEYEKDGRYTTVYVTEETDDWIRIPKIWYKGYKAVTADGKELKCKMGYSQFVEFNPDGYVGEVTVYYAHTWWLYVLEVLCFGVIIFNLGKLFLKLINNKYTFFGRSLFKNRKEISNE